MKALEISTIERPRTANAKLTRRDSQFRIRRAALVKVVAMKLWLFLIAFGLLLVYAGSQGAKMLFGPLS